MKRMKQFLALGLSLALLFTAAGCGGGDAPKDNASGQKAEQGGEGGSGEFEKVAPSTNAEVQDLGGYEFTIAATFQYYDDPTGKDLIVSEQVWQARREEVEQLYNCKIKVVPVPENLSAKILAGEKVADLVQLDLCGLYNAIGAGYLRPLDSIEGLDMGDERWKITSKYTELASYKDRPYALSYAVPVEVRGGIVYNKTLLASLGITEDIPTLVRNGEWTYDKFLELCQKATVDANNDGVPESYGVMSQSGDKFCSDFINANGGRMAVMGEDGKVVENFSDQKVIDGLTYATDLANTYNVAYIPEAWRAKDTFLAGGYNQQDFVNEFINGKAAFYMCETWVMNQLIKPAASGIEYGFAPMPKGPGAEDYSCDGHYMLGFGVTVNNQDLDKAVVIMNALAERAAGYEGDDWIDPAIEVQFFQDGDTDSVEMYKMMYENSNFDYIYGIGDLNELYNNALQPAALWNQGSPSSVLSSMRGSMQSYLDTVYNGK